MEHTLMIIRSYCCVSMELPWWWLQKPSFWLWYELMTKLMHWFWRNVLKQRSPALLAPGVISWKTIFPRVEGRIVWNDTHAHYIYCVRYSYYHTSSTSGQQALDPGGRDPSSNERLLSHYSFCVKRKRNTTAVQCGAQLGCGL